jgi:hypothetical protein
MCEIEGKDSNTRGRVPDMCARLLFGSHMNILVPFGSKWSILIEFDTNVIKQQLAVAITCDVKALLSARMS